MILSRMAAAAVIAASAVGLVACGEKTSADPGARRAPAQTASVSAARPIPRLVDPCAALRGACVVLVEKNRVGGTCLNVGCIPTKSTTRAVHAQSR